MERVLEQLGLTKVESKIYITLLELGPSLAGQISRKSGVHRRNVYDATERLIEKGLIGYILRNNRRYFEATDPERILEILKEKEEKVNEILPNLKARYNSVKEKQETVFYKGKDGLKTIFEDQLNIGKEILILGASPLANEILRFYFKWFDKRRAKKRIWVRILFDESVKKNIGKIPLSKVRYLPKDYSSPTAINIYGDKTAIILWSEEKPIAIVIKNKEISEGYRKYFELMWKIAKE